MPLAVRPFHFGSGEVFGRFFWVRGLNSVWIRIPGVAGLELAEWRGPVL
ncbi:MAG: hypothetical protein ACREB9_06280 [Thermoplasmata archaeon]